MKYKFLLILPLLFLFAGCSLISPVKTDPDRTYLINVVPCTIKKVPRRHITILVIPPESNVLFNSNTIAYTVEPHQIAYFSKNTWAATPAQMLHPLIVQTLQNTNYFHAVLTTAAIGHVDYILNTQLIQLQQKFFCNNTSVVVIKLRAQIINATTNQVIAARQFCYAVGAPMPTPYGGVIAANKATAHILKQLANFVLNAI